MKPAPAFLALAVGLSLSGLLPSVQAQEETGLCDSQIFTTIEQEEYLVQANESLILEQSTIILAERVVILGVIKGADSISETQDGVSICIKAEELVLEGAVVAGDGYGAATFVAAGRNATFAGASGTNGGGVLIEVPATAIQTVQGAAVISGRGGDGQGVILYESSLTSFGFCASNPGENLTAVGGAGGASGLIGADQEVAAALEAGGATLSLGQGGQGGDAKVLFGNFAGGHAYGGPGGASGSQDYALGEFLSASSGGNGGDALVAPCLDADSIGLGLGLPRSKWSGVPSQEECETILRQLLALNIDIDLNPCETPCQDCAAICESDEDCSFEIPTCEDIRDFIRYEAYSNMAVNPCEALTCVALQTDAACELTEIPCVENREDYPCNPQVNVCDLAPAACEDIVDIPCTAPGVNVGRCLTNLVLELCYYPIDRHYQISVCGTIDDLLGGNVKGNPGQDFSAKGDDGEAGNTGAPGDDAGWSFVDGNAGVSVGAGSDGIGASMQFCGSTAAGHGSSPDQSPQGGAGASAGGGEGGAGRIQGGNGGNGWAKGGRGGNGGDGGSGGAGLLGVNCIPIVLVTHDGGNGASGDLGGNGGGSASGGRGGAGITGGNGGDADGEGADGGRGGDGGSGGLVEIHSTCYAPPANAASCGAARLVGEPQDGYVGCGGTGGGYGTTTLHGGGMGDGIVPGTPGRGGPDKFGKVGEYGIIGQEGRPNDRCIAPAIEGVVSLISRLV